MENNIPSNISWELEQLGVMPRHLPDDVPDEPTIPRNFDFRMPEFDENGDPEF